MGREGLPRAEERIEYVSYAHRNIGHEENEMRSIFYGTVLVCLLAGLLAFSTAPAAAETASNQLTQETATMGHKDQSANPGNVDFSGQAKAGANSPNMSNSLIDCQRAQLGKYCSMPQWAIGKGTSSKNRKVPDMMN
jgi:hypothetical protein